MMSIEAILPSIEVQRHECISPAADEDVGLDSV